MATKTKVSLAAIFVIAIILTLATVGMTQATTYYLTVDEFLNDLEKYQDKSLKISGLILGDSVKWDPGAIELRFSIKGEEHTLPIYYQGLKPDNFVDGWEAIVEGKMGDNGVLIADQLLIKCPSKYEAAKEEE